MLHESVTAPTHPALAPFVATMTGYRHEGMPPGTHRGLPSPYLTLIVTVDEPLVLAAHADPGQPPGRYDALVGGLHTRPVLISHQGRQWGVQVSLTPLGARGLLGAPAAALASWDVELADVVGPAAAQMTERLRAAPGWAARLGVMQDALLGLVRPDVALPPEVAQAWRLTTQGHGRLRVDDVAREVGWSPRHLAERLRAETGLAPKEAARVARFDRARRLLARRVGAGRSANLAGLAAACGYYDQAHLAREWRSLSGLSPSGWLAAELGFVQAANTTAVPGSAA